MSDFVAGLLKRHSVDVNGEDNVHAMLLARMLVSRVR